MTDETTTADAGGDVSVSHTDAMINDIVKTLPPETDAAPQTDQPQGDAEKIPEDAPDKPKPKSDMEYRRKKAEAAFYKREAKRLEAALADSKKNTETLKRPNIADFEGKDGAEYVEAAAQYAAEVAANKASETAIERQLKDQEDALSAMEKAEDEERNRALDENYSNVIKAFPDFDELLDKHSVQGPDGRKYLPLSDAARSAIFGLDDPAYGMRQIFAEGRFDELNNQPTPHKAAVMLAQYTDKALLSLQTKKVSTAPEPISAAKGNASGGKTLEQMSPSEILRLARQ